MISITPSAFLADRLAELDAEGLEALAGVAGVELKVARRAAAGEPVAASDALCLFAARGYDPLTLEQIPRKRIGTFDRNTLALFLKVHMRSKKLTVRNVGAATGMNTRVVQAIRDGKPIGLGNVCKACAYLNLHPFDQCERVREAA